MKCPAPLLDDIDQLRELSGSRLVNARPHPSAMPKHLDEDLVLKDYRVIVDFMLSYSASPDTFKSYRREIDRFALWLFFVRKETLPSVKRMDIESYLDFLKNPPLEWRSTEVRKRFIDSMGQRIPNPEWRPFVSTVSKAAKRNGAVATEKSWTQSQSALKSTIAILRTFFEFLLNEEHINRNPVAQLKSKARKAASVQRAGDVKRLTKVQVRALFSALEAERIALGPDQYERLRFMLCCLISMYLRISDIAATGDRQPVQGDFHYKTHNRPEGQVKTWWFKVLGKGNKLRQIPVSDDLLEALKRYRSSLGLSPLPSIGESLPLFLKVKGKGGLTSSRHVRAMLQNLFDKAYLQLKNEDLPEEADGLTACTVHWLRHTGISEDVQNRPLIHVRDGAGHSSLATTGIYIENDDYETYQSANESSLLDRLSEQKA